MSRLPASALEESDQIHAILRPILVEVGAAARRASLLGVGPAGHPNDARAGRLALGELDQVIDGLSARMRVDPRPAKTQKRDTRDAMRAPPDTSRAAVRDTREMPPLPPELPRAEGDAARTAKPITRETERPPPPPAPRTTPTTGRTARPPTQLPVMPDLPPPVPMGKGKEPEHHDFDESPPPVPTGKRETTPPIPVSAPPLPQGGPRRASMPVFAASEVTGPIVLARPGNAPETFLLYDDIVMLSAMNDRDGLLISLERLLVLAKLEDHVRVFIDANEPKLIALYESHLKSFSRAPQMRPPAVDNTMPRVYLRGEKVAAVLAAIDGRATIADIVKQVGALTRIETLSVVAQLQRAGVIDI